MPRMRPSSTAAPIPTSTAHPSQSPQLVTAIAVPLNAIFGILMAIAYRSDRKKQHQYDELDSA